MADFIVNKLDKSIKDISRISILKDELHREKAEYEELHNKQLNDVEEALHQLLHDMEDRLDSIDDAADSISEILKTLYAFSSSNSFFELKIKYQKLKKLEWIRDYLKFAKLISSQDIDLGNVNEFFALLGSLKERWEHFSESGDAADGSEATPANCNFEDLSLFTKFVTSSKDLCLHLRLKTENVLLKEAIDTAWPSQSGPLPDTFLEKVRALCVLQHGFLVSSLGGEFEDEDNDHGLWFISVLMKPIVARFDYHFKGTRKTARIDKPEWMYRYLLSTIDTVLDTSLKPLQQIVNDVFCEKQGTVMATSQSVIEGFVTGIQGLAHQWIKDVVDANIDDSVYYHIISETFKFDDMLEEDGIDFLRDNLVSREFTSSNYELNRWIDIEADVAKRKIKDIFDTWPLSEKVEPRVKKWGKENTATGLVEEPAFAKRLVTLSQIMISRLSRVLSETDLVPSQRYLTISELFISRIIIPIFKQLHVEVSLEFKQALTPRSPHTETYCVVVNAIDFVMTYLEEATKHPAILNYYMLLEPLMEELGFLKQRMVNHLVDYFTSEFVFWWSDWIENNFSSLSVDVDPTFNALLNNIRTTMDTIEGVLSPVLFRRFWASLGLSMDKNLFKRISTESIRQNDAFIAQDGIALIYSLWGKYIDNPQMLFRKCYEAFIVLTLESKLLLALDSKLKSDTSVAQGYGMGLYRLSKVEILALLKMRNYLM